MPKSDTWPGGIGLDTVTDLDSAGSCDSVVSANSGFSDDSLEHLSAEEKACLMFLEETIDSLDIEEDSGLSNDEPDHLPSPGNLAAKLADLSASMSKSKLNSSQKHASEEPVKKNVDTKPMQSYLVPTPLAVANSSPCSLSTAKPSILPERNLSSKPHFTPSSNKPHEIHSQKNVAPRVPLEVNVVVPPSTKTRDYSVRTTEGLPRGPLSYEALVHLRRSASAKKTPLCPTIDHTVDLDKPLSVTAEGSDLRNPPRSDRSDRSNPKACKTGPPVVAPKPKKIPAHLKLNEAPIPTDSSYNVKSATDPKVVKMEALQKLGLLKHQKSETETAAPPSAPKAYSSLDPTSKGPTRGPSNGNPLRSPSFCYSQLPTESKNKPLQSNASFHHYSRHDQQPLPASHPAQSCGMKAAGLERSATLDHHRNGGNCQPVSRKPSNLVAYTVMVVPGMGADRKEALRKLGLLKD